VIRSTGGSSGGTDARRFLGAGFVAFAESHTNDATAIPTPPRRPSNTTTIAASSGLIGRAP
jgi:hypothetical protein